MKHGIVSTIHLVPPIDVPANKEPVFPLSQKSRLVSTCMASKNSPIVDVVGVRRLSANVVWRNQELIKILLDRYSRRKVVEYMEWLLPKSSSVVLEIKLNPS